jgi:hypothetical protein
MQRYHLPQGSAFRSAFFAGFLALITGTVTAADTADFSWEVLNRFTLFENVQESDAILRTEKSADIFLRYLKGEWRVKSPFGTQELPIEATWWDEAKGHYKAGFYQRPRHVMLSASVKVVGECIWTVADTKKVQPCTVPFQGVIPNLNVIPIAVVANNETVVRTNITVGHRLIIGLGDSYGSGEGNPDSPTSWKDQPQIRQDPLNGYLDLNAHQASLFNWPRMTVAAAPKWLSQKCHRSFWSWQLQTALTLASSDPHSVVTFGGYSCSGAEIWDGVLAKQKMPPGTPRKCIHNARRQKEDSETDECFAKEAQLSAVTEDLCDEGELKKSWIDDLPGSPYFDNKEGIVRIPRLECTSGLNNGNRIEAILLSIGGNDVGFSGVIRWSLTPARTYVGKLVKAADRVWSKFVHGPTTCPSQQAYQARKVFGDCTLPSSADRRTKHLPTAYEVLDRELQRAFGGMTPTIYATKYINPLMEKDGKQFCAIGEVRELGLQNNPNRQSGWDGLVTVIMDEQNIYADKWGLNISKGEAELLARDVVKPLTLVAYPTSWKVIDSHRTAFVSHGWCSSETPKADKDFYFPAWNRNVGWHAKRQQPRDWNAYASRTRWFRTASDSILTQYEPYDSGIGGSLNGAFHPTAQGHAAIADAAVKEILKTKGTVASP